MVTIHHFQSLVWDLRSHPHQAAAPKAKKKKKEKKKALSCISTQEGQNLFENASSIITNHRILQSVTLKTIGRQSESILKATHAWNSHSE